MSAACDHQSQVSPTQPVVRADNDRLDGDEVASNTWLAARGSHSRSAMLSWHHRGQNREGNDEREAPRY